MSQTPNPTPAVDRLRAALERIEALASTLDPTDPKTAVTLGAEARQALDAHANAAIVAVALRPSYAADARLIAAAPKLLYALNKLLAAKGAEEKGYARAAAHAALALAAPAPAPRPVRLSPSKP